MQIKLNEKQQSDMFSLFKTLGRKALYADHYTLAEKLGKFNPQEWREFLLLPSTIEFVRAEMDVIRATAMNEILADAGDSTSVGKAQLLNAIINFQRDHADKKEGPIFVYTHVPLNSEQEKAPNTQKLNTDIFRKPQSPF